MDINDGIGRDASRCNTMRHFAQRLLWLVPQGLRWAAFGVLALLRPILIPVLTWVAVGGVLLWAIFVLIAGDPDFPALRVLGISAGCALGAVVYYAALEWLMPGYLGRGR